MKSSLAAVLTHKQASYKDPMIDQLAIEDGDVSDEGRKKKRRTGGKKELTEAQKQQQDFDKNMRENLSLQNLNHRNLLKL